ncbi:MAG: hypothetical protein Q8M76_17200 [Spirochaetaceae bacterium]|nr:hypothetical protein [Spirochaetaceae bacterium]
MSFEEKFTWVSAAVQALVAGFYSAFVVGQLRSLPVAQIAYQKPLLIAIGATIVMTIAGTILMSIGTAVSVQIAGKGSVDDIDRKDERDVAIDRRGELFGHYVSSVGALGALALGMLRFDQFWITNALFLSFSLGSLAAAAAKLVAYRRGY